MFDGIMSSGDQHESKLAQLSQKADRAYAQGDRAACVEAIEDLYHLFDNNEAQPRPAIN